MNRFRFSAIAFSILCTAALNARGEVIIQYFETRWDEMYQRLPEIAEIGYESIWTPPPGKSPIGGPYPHAYGGNVGYNSLDRFDLGDHPQRGHWETRYGSRTSMRNMVDNAHQMDLKIYPDIVFNHTGNGPDYRTYPGMVPQDFHVWVDPSQPGGFKRAPRMFQWTPDNGFGGTLHQELVSLMDIVLEFDNRFQNGPPNYAPDPTPFVRHPGDREKYPYHPTGDLPTENSRQFVTRWINWLGYAMDYDGVRLDAPKHVGKEYFGLPGQSQATKDQTLIYNIQKNFNERRGLTDTDPFDDMYSNYLRRDDALVYSEFFIGSIGETDYWRNPNDPNWGIKTRYLDFPRKSQMIMAAFNGGNLAALDNIGAGFSPEEGVIFAHSHDEDPPGKLELAYAYILTRVGTPVVYFTGNNLADNEDKEENGITWMRKGYDGALGDYNMGTIPNLVYIHNQFARGREWTRWADGDFFAHERYDDINSNGQPNSGEGLLLVALNDSGSDQTRNGIQTSFAPGTVLKDYSGRNPDTVTVGSDGKVNIRVPGWWGQGFVCYAPFNAEGPASGSPINFAAGPGVTTMPWVVPGGRDAAAKNRTITRVTGNSATINVFYREPLQGGEAVNNVLLKWGQGRNLNALAPDITGKDIVNGGYEQMTRIAAGHYQIVADLTGVPEGLHTVKARLFNGRSANRPALYQTFTTTVYVDRRGPDLAFVNLNEDETVEGARVVTVENADRTLHNLTYSINGGPSLQADQVIQGRWRIALDGLTPGANSITLTGTEADRGATRGTINTSTLTRNFTVEGTGPSIAINHASGATIAEPFFKTVVTVPTGQGITASDIKLFWNGYEQLALTENPVGSGKFESTFNGRYRQGGVDRIFYGAFVNGPNFFEAVVTKNGQENRSARRVVFNLYGQNLHDSDGDGLPDDIELNNFLSGRNPGPNRPLPGDGPGLDNIPNNGENWPRLNPMNAETFYNGQWDGDRDSDGDGVKNIDELLRGFRISGNVYAYDMYNGASVPPATVGSFASSSLSMSGGNKVVTITYRPNDGPLASASAVTVNITPVGSGSAQSFTMTGGPTEFTYSYTVPANATAVNYTFASGGTTDNTGGASWSASTTAAFVMDGQFDSQNFVVSDNGMRIYAAIRGNKLYTATWSPKGGANDHLIYITDEFGNPVTAGPATATDSASNYTTWANGNNQGTGFDAWSISNAGSVSGAFLGDPSAAGIQGMSSKSFGLYAKGGAGSSAAAIRSFPALNVGDSIAFQWGVNWDGGNGANGKKGFNLWAGTSFLMNAEQAGSADIVVGGSSSGMGYGTQAMNWTITRTAADKLQVRATRRDGGVFTRELTVSSSAPTRLEFYASNLADGDGRQPYFNDLRIYRNGASAKGGQVYGAFNGTANSKPWLFSTPNVASSYGFKTSGRNWLGNQGQALESELDLVEAFGSMPRIIYIAAVAYSGGFGGTIQSQAPPLYGNSSNDLEIPEYQPLNTDSIRDEDLDGRFDVGTPEMIVSVNGNDTDGNYGLRRFYLDEVAGDESELTVKFKPNTAVAPSQVEVFTNLNRRDHAVLEEDPSTVTTGSNTYFRAYTMSGPNADGYYTATLPVELCGAYRLQVRYKVPGVNNGNFVYYTDNGLRRDCAVVVSPKKALEINMYEVNPLIAEAKDTTFDGRGTFLDLVNDSSIPGEAGGYEGRPDALNKDHYAALGVNMLWLQPIHPIGVDGRDTNPKTGQPFDPGSPYAVRDYWSVAPMLGRANTAASADAEFQTFVQRLDQWGVGVMMDGTFNHSAPDVIMGKGAADLGITTNAGQEIRDFNPGWYAKEGFPGTPAASKSEIAIAPDRNDFGNWTDVREFYFGNYDALVKEKGTQNPNKSYPDNAYKLAFLLERDDFEGHTPTTRQVWDYFAYYPIYWLEKSGHTASTPKEQSHIGIDGLRCDFAQGLPSQFWEYAINKTRSRKWDFVFMAESLDGSRTVGNSSRHGVGYRSARHFDVLNENIVFYWRDTFFGYPANGGAGTAKTPSTGETFKAFDDRRQSFDNVTLLNNLVSHDEVFPHNDVWRLAYAYAQTGALDGIPMILYGQEAGAQNSKAGYGASEPNFGAINAANNTAEYEQNFGKNIPNFKVYNHMSSIWNNRTPDEWRLQNFYGRVNKARLAAPALMGMNMYFLSKTGQNAGLENNMLAVGKVENLGQPAGGNNSVVFAFVNNNHLANPTVAATFDLNAKVPGTDLNYFGIERGRLYNVRDLLADNPNDFVWKNNQGVVTHRTGADLIDNGLFVGLPNTAPGTGSHQAQYLQLVDVSPRVFSFSPPQFMTYGTSNILTASVTPPAPVTYSLVGGDTSKVTLTGNQLVINAGAGSVTIRASIQATADHPADSKEATVTFQKAAQTITFVLGQPSVPGGTSVPLTATSTSGLPITYVSSAPTVASINQAGTAATALNQGQTTITASQTGNENFLVAESVTQVLTVTAGGPSFESLFPGQDPNSDIDGDGVPALAEYALNGSSDSNDIGKLPQVEEGSRLAITAVVRANDPRLTVDALTSINLASGWNGPVLEGAAHPDQSGVTTGFERRRYFIDLSGPTDNQGFIRMRFRLQSANP
jgi:glycosidase